MKSVTTPGEAAEIPLQLLLGTCKHNPLFSLQRDKAWGRLMFDYGAELLESFPDAPAHFALRLCAGRLYNAGLPKKPLADAFGLDIHTIARVADAPLLANPDELMRNQDPRPRLSGLLARSADLDKSARTAQTTPPPRTARGSAP